MFPLGSLGQMWPLCKHAQGMGVAAQERLPKTTPYTLLSRYQTKAVLQDVMDIEDLSAPGKHKA